VILLSATISMSASAQNEPPYDTAIDVQLFEYAVGPNTFFAVADADVGKKGQLAFDVFFTFLTNPFTVYDVAPATTTIVGERSSVVSSMLAADVGGAYGLTDSLQLGVSLPVVLSMTGDGLDRETAMASAEGLAISGLGDLRAELKMRLWRRGDVRFGAIAGLTLPSSFGSGGSKFLGDDLPSVRGRFALHWSHGRLSLGANAGVMLRKPRAIYASEIGQQASWATAAAVRVTERFFLVSEAFGRTGLLAYDVDRSPLEVGGGLRVFITSSLALVAGGGTGLIKGIGSPDVRVFTSLGYAPDVRDSDGDGVINGRDGCVLVAEDKDGWLDSDGCPEDDNDEDRRPDATDKCPNQAEDLDGFDDEDGCPELDNDGDGIVDLKDKCANVPEDRKEPFPADGCSVTTHDADFDGLVDAIDTCVADPEDIDGFEDADGCPDADQDNDGVEDAADLCSLCTEDKDGFQDEDGCPELDNDNDGILDSVDRCPIEPETVNAVDDFDGCPDQGGITIASFDGEKILVDRAPPFDRNGLSVAAQLIVDQVALRMLANGDVTHWLVAVAEPKERYAQRQAEWIRDQLIKRGVAKSAIELLSAAGSSKLVAVAQERRPSDTPMVCPTPEVKPRPERSGSPAAPPGAAPHVPSPRPNATAPKNAIVTTPTPADQ
jgi:OmpA-OmpF porin, OOP family